MLPGYPGYKVPFEVPQSFVMKLKIDVGTAVELLQYGARLSQRRRGLHDRPSFSEDFQKVFFWPTGSDGGSFAILPYLRQEIETQYHRYMIRPPRVMYEETVIENQVVSVDRFVFLTFEPARRHHPVEQPYDGLINRLLAGPMKRLTAAIDTKEQKFKLVLIPALDDPRPTIELRLRKGLQIQTVAKPPVSAVAGSRVAALA